MFKEIDILAIKTETILSTSLIYELFPLEYVHPTVFKDISGKGTVKILFGILIPSLSVAILEHLSHHLADICFFFSRFKVTEAFSYFMKPF